MREDRKNREYRRRRWGIYKERRGEEEPEKMKNEPECKRAIEKTRDGEREKKREGEKRDVRSSCRGDCADVRGKVLRRALPDLTTHLSLPLRVDFTV